MNFQVGVDIGGTFTDLVVMDGEGRLTQCKVASTPSDPSEGVMAGLKELAHSLGLGLQEFLSRTIFFSHGTTIATNAIVERKGAKVGLITTRGFEDTLLIMRAIGRVAGLGEREIMHFSATDKPEPVVPRSLIRGVMERVDYKGEVIAPLKEGQAKESISQLLEQGVEVIAVCLLWSPKNPTHERRVKEFLEEISPRTLVCLSSDLVPMVGEYERTATTVLNSYVQPAFKRYMSKLGRGLHEGGLPNPPLIMQCSGGVSLMERATSEPIFSLQSGPVGGAVASQFFGQLLGYPNIINTDMGGTTFDVSLIVDGEMLTKSSSVAAQYHVYIPTIEITSIGSGGGSIARVMDGKLKVGPESAGADPGPACYGRGGEEATVTDADLILGYLNPDNFLGGKMPLDKERAIRTLTRKVADPLKMDPVEAANGVYTVINSQMADLIRKVTVERGYDPRSFVLFSYGGAGPVHSASFTRELGVPVMVVPLLSSVHSALGLVTSPVVHVFATTSVVRLPEAVAGVEAVFLKLEAQAMVTLMGEGFDPGDFILERSADLRFRRQVHEVLVPVPGPLKTERDLEELVKRFETKYEMLYGKGSVYREAGMEIVNFRVRAVGKRKAAGIRAHPLKGRDASGALRSGRDCFFGEEGRFVMTRVYDAARLEAGNVVQGPAIVEGPYTTILVRPGEVARVDQYLNLLVEEG